MKLSICRSLGLFAAALFILTGCRNKTYEPELFYVSQGDGTEEVRAMVGQLSEKKIYFGHQSVGQNIIDGLKLWEDLSGVGLSMGESRELTSLPETSLVHFRVGTNRDPHGKIDDFAGRIEQIPEEEHAAAFFKFCYVDFHEDTDVDELFTYYREKMFDLKENHPNINFIVTTVPAMAVQKGWRGIAKKLLGRAPYGYLQNITIHQFNQKLISEFEGVLPIFDLAKIEVTRPDGSLETFRYKGDLYSCMPDYYASDFGHLNDFGARLVSYQLLDFLSKELK
jgi:hypothetical protein